LASVGFAQSSVDAVRFGTPGLGVGARALGMGGAYTGVANDYSALFWNPAGLAQLEHAEFSFGMSHLNYRDQSSYFNLSKSQSANSTTLNSLGLAFPVPVARGSLVFSFGYNRESNYATGLSLERANVNSIIQNYAVTGDTMIGDDNFAYRLYLADIVPGSRHIYRIENNQGRRDTIFAYVLESPIVNRLKQIEKAIEGGGVNNWTIGGAADIAKNISAGLSLSYQSGSYKYEGSYSEVDNLNLYSSNVETNPRNFNSFAIDDLVESELTGFSAKFGLMFRQPDKYRIGFNVKTPTVFRVKETFSTTYTVTPDFGEVVSPDVDPSTNEYDVVTPWVLSAGGSLILNDLVLSGDVEYTDWTQLEFKNANRDLLALNKTFKDVFRATANFRGGVEYNFQQAGIRARGGFIYNTSPYEGDPSSFDQKYVTAGLGILLSESTMLDLTFVRGWWKSFRDDYRGIQSINEDITTNNIFATFSYRY
jgi:long-subunit fatty acid transport protein